jgi:hypothetical protein
MSLRLSKFRDPRGTRITVAALLAMLVLVIAASIWNPLHEWLHHDAGEADHDCAITLYATDACSDTPAPALAPTPDLIPISDEVAVERPRFASSFRFSGILEHAPPQCT